MEGDLQIMCGGRGSIFVVFSGSPRVFYRETKILSSRIKLVELLQVSCGKLSNILFILKTGPILDAVTNDPNKYNVSVYVSTRLSQL